MGARRPTAPSAPAARVHASSPVASPSAAHTPSRSAASSLVDASVRPVGRASLPRRLPTASRVSPPASAPDSANPDVLCAFALHFAEPPTSQSATEVGAGRLAERYDEHWNCEPNGATILYRDSIERAGVISLPFPLVGDAAAGRTVDLSWTVVFTAPTDPTDAVDYTQAGLEVAFRPHARRFILRDPNTNKTIEVDVQDDAEKFRQHLAAGWAAQRASRDQADRAPPQRGASTRGRQVGDGAALHQADAGQQPPRAASDTELPRPRGRSAHRGACV